MSPDAPTPEAHDDGDLPGGERLQKVMAAAGVASRRVSEDLIAAGRVLVNGRVVTEPGRRIDPETDEVVVDGTVVQLDATRRYVMLNKPVGIVSSLSDEHGRPDLRQFTEEYDERLFNVGRLDSETSGLLLLTNDGRIAHVLAHPSFGVTKTYVAKVRGQVTREVLAQLSAGIELDDGPIAADKARLVGGGAGLSRSGDSSLVEITLHSGRNRIVRRMMEAVGHPVIDLVRRQFGPLHLGTLKIGHMRALTRDELGAILTLARDPQDAQRPDDADDRTGLAEADVVVDAEKDYYDEDDVEFDPDTDARDERRRGRTTAGGPGRPGGSGPDRAPRGGDAPLSRRAEVRREQAGRRDGGRDGGRDQGGRPDRGRDERGGYQGRDDRGGAARGGYRGGADRGGPERGGYQGRDDRGGAPRSGYQGRDDRGAAPRGGGYQGRDDRAPRRDDDRRPPRDDRGGAPRSGYQGRDDRGGAPRGGGYQGRDDRGPRRDDDRRPPRDDRGGAPRSGYQGRDDRGGYQGRDDRGGAPRAGGYQGRDDRGPRRDDDRRPPRDDRGGAPRSGYQGRDDRGAAPRGGGYQGRDDRGAAPRGGGYQGRDDRGRRRDDDRRPPRDDRGGPRGGGRSPRGGDSR